MGFESFIAMKYLVKGKRHGFISLISVISVIGVAVGVMALIVVLAVMSGFDRELKEKIVGVHPHVIVETVGGIEKSEELRKAIDSSGISGVTSIAPFVQGQALIRSATNATGIAIKGIDPDYEMLEIFDKHLQRGSLEFKDLVLDLEDGTEATYQRILIGEELANLLGVSVGNEVVVIAPTLQTDPTNLKKAIKKARTQSFTVSGIFRVGMNDFDSSFALIHMQHAQELYQLGDRVSGMSVRFGHVDQADVMKAKIQGRLGTGFQVRSWMDMNRTFFAALKVEKTVMTILLSLIVLVAAFNIISTLTMVVMEKTRDIGVLRALGATPGNIRSIFVIQGFVIGGLGIVLGAIAGLALAYNLNPVSDFLDRTFGIQVFPSDIYLFDQIPSQVNMPDVWIITVTALLLSLLAGFYPANQAARLEPVKALRYE